MNAIDSLNEWTGRVVAWLFVPLVGIIAFDVILRYVFNRPTIWSWDVNAQIAGILIIMSGGYVLLKGGHIAVDVIVARLTNRKKAIIDLVTSPLFFIAFGVLMATAVRQSAYSLRIKEVAPTFFAPPLYPFKVIVVVALIFILLQGLVKFIRDLQTAIHPETGGQS